MANLTSRSRSVPWIYRKSRFLIAAIATLGGVLTAYLTGVKLSGGSALCPTSGCDQVLSSPYAEVFGIPLTLFGFLAYVAMTVFAVAPLRVDIKENRQLRSQLENWTWWFLLIGGTSMAIFSGYLMYLLAYKIQALCLYCLISAICSFSLFLLAIFGRDWEDIGQVIFIGLIVGMITLVGTLGVYASVNSPKVDVRDPFAITTTSGPAEMALAEHLTNIGAKKYGGYRCPHCQTQKEMFGQEAFALVDYIECDPSGPNAQPDVCRAAGIKGYPTWDIKGKRYPGVQSLEKLAELSGYQGPKNFQNSGEG